MWNPCPPQLQLWKTKHSLILKLKSANPFLNLFHCIYIGIQYITYNNRSYIVLVNSRQAGLRCVCWHIAFRRLIRTPFDNRAAHHTVSASSRKNKNEVIHHHSPMVPLYQLMIQLVYEVLVTIIIMQTQMLYTNTTMKLEIDVHSSPNAIIPS